MATDVKAPVSAAAFLSARAAVATAIGAFPARIDTTGTVATLKRDVSAAVAYCAGLPSMQGIERGAKRDAAIMSECAHRLNAVGFRPASGPVSKGSKDSRPYWTGLSLAVLVRELSAV